MDKEWGQINFNQSSVELETTGFPFFSLSL